MDEMHNIGPEAFTDGEVISYKGVNYYKACDALVQDHLDDGGQSFCVKRSGHAGWIHEDYFGVTTVKSRPARDLELADKTLEDAVFLTLGTVSMCWEDITLAGVFESTSARAYGDQLVARIRQAGPIYD